MDGSFWIMIAATIALTGIAGYYQGWEVTLHGLYGGGRLLVEVIPRMIFAFALAGLVQVLIPKELIVGWIGAGSGFKGLVVGSLAGTLTPGGPMTHFPIVVSFYRAGADVGPIIAYITAWALLGIHRLIIWEIPLLGAEISLVRFAVSLALPPLVGYLGGNLMRVIR